MKTIKTKSRVGIHTTGSGSKQVMTVGLIIEKYFHPKNFWGNRKCKILNGFRINRNGQLQENNYGWEKTTWLKFNEALKLHSEINDPKKNDVSVMNWEFKNEINF